MPGQQPAAPGTRPPTTGGPHGGRSGVLVLLLVLLAVNVVVLAAALHGSPAPAGVTIPYTPTFLEQVDAGRRVTITARPAAGPSMVPTLLMSLAPTLLVVVLPVWMMRRAGGGAAQMTSFGRARAQRVGPDAQTVTFDDVAGIDEAKGGTHRARRLPPGPGEVPAPRRTDSPRGAADGPARHGQDAAGPGAGRRGRGAFQAGGTGDRLHR